MTIYVVNLSCDARNTLAPTSDQVTVPVVNIFCKFLEKTMCVVNIVFEHIKPNNP